MKAGEYAPVLPTDKSIVDWEGLEDYVASAESLPDCIPTNAREWVKFRDQYQAMEDLLLGLPDSDPSEFYYNQNTSGYFGSPSGSTSLRDKMLLLDKGYKKSPIECTTDFKPEERGRWNLFGVNWDVVVMANEFVKRVGWCSIQGKGVTTMEDQAIPKYTMHLDVRDNKLESFVGGPTYVHTNYNIGSNPIKSLEGLGRFGTLIYVNTPLSKAMKRLVERKDSPWVTNHIMSMQWETFERMCVEVELALAEEVATMPDTPEAEIAPAMPSFSSLFPGSSFGR